MAFSQHSGGKVILSWSSCLSSELEHEAEAAGSSSSPPFSAISSSSTGSEVAFFAFLVGGWPCLPGAWKSSLSDAGFGTDLVACFSFGLLLPFIGEQLAQGPAGDQQLLHLPTMATDL